MGGACTNHILESHQSGSNEDLSFCIFIRSRQNDEYQSQSQLLATQQELESMEEMLELRERELQEAKERVRTANKSELCQLKTSFLALQFTKMQIHGLEEELVVASARMEDGRVRKGHHYKQQQTTLHVIN